MQANSTNLGSQETHEPTPDDYYLREAQCAKRLGICRNLLRNWAREGFVKSYAPFGSKVRLYYWPEVKTAVMRTMKWAEVEPIGKL